MGARQTEAGRGPERRAKEMGMKSTRAKVTAMASAVMLLAALGFSQTVVATAQEAGNWGRGFDRLLGIRVRALDLTDAQRTQIKDIMTKEKPTIQPLMQQLLKSHKQMRQLESAGTFDETKVRALAREQSQTMTEFMVQKARIKSELMQVLTADQKTKLEAMEARAEAGLERHLARAQGGTGETELPNQAAPNH